MKAGEKKNLDGQIKWRMISVVALIGFEKQYFDGDRQGK